jgi:prevent-host-death family protein
LTIIVSVTSQPLRDDPQWPVADAKAHFSEMIDRALSQGPQVITRKGKRTVVVVPFEEWERRTRRQGTLADFFAKSPLRGSGLDVRRSREMPRDLGW